MRLNITLLLTASIFVVFALQTAFAITDSFALVSADVISRPWILLTSIFLHSGLQHLISNAFALLFFGLALESIIGSKKIAAIFFATGITASIASSFMYTAALGASGALFGIIGTLTALRPKMAVYAFGIPLPMVAASLFWALIDLGGLFAPSGTANLAHLAGLAAGLTIGYSLRKQFMEPKIKREKILTENELAEWEDMYMGR